MSVSGSSISRQPSSAEGASPLVVAAELKKESKDVYPCLLNENLSIHAYTGNCFSSRNTYDIKNVLTPTVDPFHCSGKGVGHTLTLKCKDGKPAELTHMMILGPGSRCTEPTKSGIVWVSNEEPKAEWGDKYQGMSAGELQEIIANRKDGEDEIPCIYYSTDPNTRACEVECKGHVGKYFMVRFLDTHHNQENVDVAAVAFAGFRTPVADQPKDMIVHMPGDTWFNRKHCNPWCGTSTMKSTFSSGGWVCDGRDYSGGCRSGMVSFHQSTASMVTFRCNNTGFDLCEDCMRDPTFGKVTTESIMVDMLSLDERSPEQAKAIGLKGCSPTATANRIVKMIRHSPGTLARYFDNGLIETLVRILQSQADQREDSRNSRRSARASGFTGPSKHKSLNTSWRINLELMREVINVLFNDSPGCLSINDKVWTKRPNDSMEWGLGRITKPEEGEDAVADKNLPSFFQNTATDPTSTSLLVTFADEVAAVERNVSDIWKMTVEEDQMMATVSLYQEIKNSATPDEEKIKRLIEQEHADAFAFNGEGMNCLITAVDLGKAAHVKVLLENHICPDAETTLGTALQLARKKQFPEIERILLDFGASDVKPVKDIKQYREDVARQFLTVLFAIVRASEHSTNMQDCIIVLVDLITKVSKEDLVDALQVQKVAQDFAAYLQSVICSDSLSIVRHALQVIGSVLSKKDAHLTKFLLASGAQNFANKLVNARSIDGGMSLGISSSATLDELQKTAKVISDKFLAQEQEFSNSLTHPLLEQLSNKLESGDLTALETLRSVLRKMKRVDFRADTFLTPYMLDRYGISKKLLNFFHGVKVMEGNHFVASGSVDQRWQTFHEIFAGEDLDLLLESLHGLVSMTEQLPVYRHKRERGLKVLIDPLTVKMSFHNSKDVYRPDMTQELKIEPLVSIDQLTHTILSTTPIPDKKFLESCFGLMDAQLEFDDGKIATVTDFRITTDLNLPVHTIKFNESGTVEKTILSLRKVRMKTGSLSSMESAMSVSDGKKSRASTPLPSVGIVNNIPYLKHRVALAQLKIAVSPLVFNSICTDLLMIFDLAKQEFDKNNTIGQVQYAKTLLKQEIPPAGKSFLELCNIIPSPTKRHIKSRPDDQLVDLVKREMTDDDRNDTKTEDPEKKQNPANERIHTVEIIVSEDIPFDMVWPMIRDEVMGAVRQLPPIAKRCWPGGMMEMEAGIQASAPTSGSGVVAKALTKAEADTLLTRVQNVIQGRIVIDREAIKSIGNGIQESPGATESLSLGSVVQAQVVPKDADLDWAPCTLVGKKMMKDDGGSSSSGNGAKKDKEVYAVLTKEGVLMEGLPSTRVKHSKAKLTGGNDASSHAGRAQSIMSLLSSAGLLRSSDVPQAIRRRAPPGLIPAGPGNASRLAPIDISFDSNGVRNNRPGSSGSAGASDIIWGGRMQDPRPDSATGSSRPGSTGAPIPPRRQQQAMYGQPPQPPANASASAPNISDIERPSPSMSPPAPPAPIRPDAPVSNEESDRSPSPPVIEGSGSPSPPPLNNDDARYDDALSSGMEGNESMQFEDVVQMIESERGLRGPGNDLGIHIHEHDDDHEDDLDEMDEMDDFDDDEEFDDLDEEAMEGVYDALSGGGNGNFIVRMDPSGRHEVLGPGYSGGRSFAERFGGPAPRAGGPSAGEGPSLSGGADDFDASRMLEQVRQMEAFLQGVGAPPSRGIAGGAGSGPSGSNNQPQPARSGGRPRSREEQNPRLPRIVASSGSGGPRRSQGHLYGGPYQSMIGSSDRKSPVDIIKAQFDALKRASDFSSMASSLDHPIVQRLSPDDLAPTSASSLAHLGKPSKCLVLPKLNLWCGNATDKYDGKTSVFSMLHEINLKKNEGKVTFSADSVHSIDFGFNFDAAEASAPSDTPSPNNRSKKRRRVNEKSNDADPTGTLIELLGLLRQNEDTTDAVTREGRWQSSKIDKKLRQQLEDPLTVLSGTLPPWVTKYMTEYPFLFSLKIRKLFLRYIGFGTSFAVHWIQQNQVGDLLKRRAIIQTELAQNQDGHRMQEMSQELSNIEDHVTRSNFWFGTLNGTLMKTSKGDELLTISEQLIDKLASSGALKNMIEVQFTGETGFGNAVTKNFFVEICKAFQEREANNHIPMWVDDSNPGDDLSHLQCRRGLMIKPLTKDHPGFNAVIRRYRFLGRCAGLALREGYLMPLPLTVEFFSMFKGDKPTHAWLPRPGNGLTGEFLGVCADFVEELDMLRVSDSQSSSMSKDERRKRMDSAGSSKAFSSKFLSGTQLGSNALCFTEYSADACFLETGFSGAERCHLWCNTGVKPTTQN